MNRRDHRRPRQPGADRGKPGLLIDRPGDRLWWVVTAGTQWPPGRLGQVVIYRLAGGRCEALDTDTAPPS